MRIGHSIIWNISNWLWMEPHTNKLLTQQGPGSDEKIAQTQRCFYFHLEHLCGKPTYTHKEVHKHTHAQTAHNQPCHTHQNGNSAPLRWSCNGHIRQIKSKVKPSFMWLYSQWRKTKHTVIFWYVKENKCSYPWSKT